MRRKCTIQKEEDADSSTKKTVNAFTLSNRSMWKILKQNFYQDNVWYFVHGIQIKNNFSHNL